MKYIIEFEDEYSMNEAGMKYHQCKQVPYWSVSHGIIKNLTPYTEPDRKAIEDEVWEFVRIITDMTEAQRKDCFGGATCNLDEYMTYKEVKAKYEAWLKQKNEIHVGDEVENASHKKGIVLNHYISPSNGLEYVRVLYMDDDGNSFVSAWEKNNVGKTGRHFDSVEKLLEEMMED